MRGALIVLTAALSTFSAGGVLLAQAPQPTSDDKKFEVASVKAAPSPAELRLAAQGGGAGLARRFGILTQPGGRFSAGTTTLKRLIAEAFEVKEYQIDGGPPWLTTDSFDITANAGADATPADVKAMLRTLLRERFGLRTHSETRQAPVYVLTIARSDGRTGSRLKPTSPECVQQIEQQRRNRQAAPGAPPPPPSEAEQRQQRERMQEQLKRLSSGDAAFTAPCGTTMMSSKQTGANALLAGGMEMTSLVSQLSGEVSAPVLDQTGLKGLFDVSLEYLSDRSFNGRPAGLDPNSTEPLPVPLTAALQQQLGLKLEKQTGPMPVVVIEAAEHPTPD